MDYDQKSLDAVDLRGSTGVAAAGLTIGALAAGVTFTRELMWLMMQDYMETRSPKLWLEVSANSATTAPIGLAPTLSIGTEDEN